MSPEESRRDEIERAARAKGWGGLARRGAAAMGDPEVSAPRRGEAAGPPPMAEWVREDAARNERPSEPRPPRAPYALPGDVASEVRRAFIGTAHARERAVDELTKAAEAYDRHRYEEALRHARAVADLVPGVGAVRELAGLAAYRAERWVIARSQLRAHFEITGDAEHLALVMDAERALRHGRAVERVYEELLEAEPGADVLAEARIVLAGAWADERRYPEAIDLLVKAGAAKKLRNPSFRHVRLWYALADVYDRAGDTANARELFARIVAVEPEAYDAAERLGEVGHSVRKNRKRRATPASTKRRDD